MMKIKAAVVREKSGPFQIEEIDLDEPRDDEVLVRIVGSGMCHTDLSAWSQDLAVPLPGVFGHEGSGVVERVGDRVRKVKPGDHVVLTFSSCGSCPACKGGVPTNCEIYFECNLAGTRLDGTTTMKKGSETIYGSFVNQSAFATHSLARESSVVKVPGDVPLEGLGPVSCAVQTGFGAVLNSLRPRIGSSMAIFGTGSVGLSAVMAASRAGCATVIAVDIHPQRLKMASDFGATHVINAGDQDPVAEIRRLCVKGVDFSLECTGLPQVLEQCVDILTIGGKCGMIGVPPANVQVSLNMRHMLDGRTIQGIIAGDTVPDNFIPPLVMLFKRGLLPFDRMITFYPLQEINRAVAEMRSGVVVKPVLLP